jgi:hypothetical protein
MAWHGEEVLDREAALRVGSELDHSRRAFGTRVTMPVKDRQGHHVGARDAHVWHCSLSLSSEEGEISDERWAHVCEEFVAGMGFTEGEGVAACRWVALRQGGLEGRQRSRSRGRGPGTRGRHESEHLE